MDENRQIYGRKNENIDFHLNLVESIAMNADMFFFKIFKHLAFVLDWK